MPAMPGGVEEGIIRGMYRLNTVEAGDKKVHVQLLGSGAILRSVQEAQKNSGREVQDFQHGVERDQLQGAAARGARLPALEHAASG